MTNKRKVINAIKVNLSSYEIFATQENLPKDQLANNQQDKILRTLSVFTKLEQRSIFIKLLKIILSHRLKIDLEKITYNEEIKQYEYILDDKIITFNMLSNFLDDKKIIKELKSNKRYGKCHERSMGYGHNFDNSKLLTGIITTNTGKYLHTVIEVIQDEKISIIDWTTNLILKKEDFIDLYSFVEISSFDAKNVFYDREIMNKFELNKLGIKKYLSYRNEIIKELEQNLNVLTEEEQEEIKNAKK